MSSDEQFVVEVLRALRSVRLEAIFVGNMAAIMQGAPVTTQDVDVLVRDTPTNRAKIERFAKAISRSVRVSSVISAGRPRPSALAKRSILARFAGVSRTSTSTAGASPARPA